MFIRFVTNKLDSDSGRRQGLFQAAAELRALNVLAAHEEDRLNGIRDWFNSKLERPTRFSLSAKPHGKAQAISWFRETAAEHISQMRTFAAMLELHDIGVQTLRTQRPGYIVYEDEFQVAAYPFADTPT